MTDDDVIRTLNDLDGAVDAARLSHFRVYIHNRSVDVTVYDGGPDTGTGRYSVEACWSDIPAADRHAGTAGWTLGNPEADLKTALSAGPHWWIFRESDD